MIKYDFYNPMMHTGDLPVRVLAFNFLDWFENITPDFKEEAQNEITFNGLKKDIQYHINRTKITEVACISPSKHIELYENFNQYLWCICYSLLVIFDESVHRPFIENKYTGQFDLENPFVKRAITVLNNGFDLLHTYKDWQFFQLPNPEKYNEYDKFYIEKTNAIYAAAMTFILLHEYAHQYLGHLEYEPTSAEESKMEEYKADDYAIDKISYNFTSQRGATFKFGIIAGISSLILLGRSLSGGNTHPDIDDRLKKAIEKMSLNELDNLWGVASLAFRFWAIKYNIDYIEYPQSIDSYKELFTITLNKINDIKNTL